MVKKHAVSLASNGKYWLARYYDSMGKRKGKLLGPKAKLGRRQALVLCERFAVELHSNPARADLSKAPTISKWIESFFALKPDLGPKARRAYLIAGQKFKSFVGEHTRIDRITPAIAAEWVTRLSEPASTNNANIVGKDQKSLSPATVAHYCRHIRCLLNEAVHQGILIANPFARIRTQPRKIERNWHYVPRELFSRILDACPNTGWKCFLALQRMGGLRKGESLATKWGMIDFTRRVLTLPETVTKTGQERIIPLDPELFALLQTVKATRDASVSDVVPTSDVDRSSDSNQHSRFITILKRAKVAPWEDLFQTLRRNAVQDLRETLKDPWAVTAIAGHSEEVERKYYLGRIRQGDLDRITGIGSDKQSAELMDLWARLTPDQQSKLLALLRAATVRAETGTETGTKSAPALGATPGKNEKEPANTGSKANAPRRTRTHAVFLGKCGGFGFRRQQIRQQRGWPGPPDARHPH